MDDVCLIETVLDTACLGLLDSLCHIHCNCTGLGVRHKALRAEHSTETADDTHHVGSCDDDFVIEEVLVLDSGEHVLCAYIVCACCLSLCCLVALCKDENANLFTCTVGKHDSASDLLVCVTAVNAKLDMDFDCLVELCLGCCDNCLHALGNIVKFILIDSFYAVLIFLTSKHYASSLTVIPMERAVPAIMLMAASTEAALRSGILSSAIF